MGQEKEEAAEADFGEFRDNENEQEAWGQFGNEEIQPNQPDKPDSPPQITNQIPVENDQKSNKLSSEDKEVELTDTNINETKPENKEQQAHKIPETKSKLDDFTEPTEEINQIQDIFK